MVINGAIVSDLDMMFIESVLQEELSLCMMMRSARTGYNISFEIFCEYQLSVILWKLLLITSSFKMHL